MQQEEERLRRDLTRNTSGGSDAGSMSTSGTDGGPIIGGNPKSNLNPYEINCSGRFFLVANPALQFSMVQKLHQTTKTSSSKLQLIFLIFGADQIIVFQSKGTRPNM